jgi:biofilm PGA synthesis lipoprotein PgaB
VLVTFDDGYQSFYDHAWPVLKAFRVPAVVNVVGAWLEEKGQVSFDGRELPRREFMSWKALRELADSGLVEIGSHSFDLHRGIQGNPQGNLEPAGTTRRYDPAAGRYEDEASYRRRVQADLERSSALIRRHVGRPPRVIAWPYGRYNAVTHEVAQRLGMTVGLTLDDGADLPDTPLWALRRILVTGAMRLWDLEREIEARASGVLAGRFPVSGQPCASLCSGCPGEGGLCSWPLEATRRERVAGAGPPEAQPPAPVSAAGEDRLF